MFSDPIFLGEGELGTENGSFRELSLFSTDYSHLSTFYSRRTNYIGCFRNAPVSAEPIQEALMGLSDVLWGVLHHSFPE